MPKGRCHAEGCDMLMEDHTTMEHFVCSIIIVEGMEKKKIGR